MKKYEIYNMKYIIWYVGASTVFWDDNIFPLFGDACCIEVSVNGGSNVVASIIFNDEQGQIHVKICLTKTGHSVLKL